jgi:hypothetical protein
MGNVKFFSRNHIFEKSHKFHSHGGMNRVESGHIKFSFSLFAKTFAFRNKKNCKNN